MHPLLSIQNLNVSIGTKEVVQGVSLTIQKGEVHAIMGPNGSGKSTLANALMGHPAYTITQGTAEFCGKNLLAMEPHERAQTGLFLAFQYPRSVAGVSLRSFLFRAYNAQMAKRNPEKKQKSPIRFQKLLQEKMRELRMDPALAERPLNEGFSGGEKKKAEVLQLLMLRPLLALMDETDSGLDIDALQVVAEGINAMRSPEFAALIITHYARLLAYVQPDYVHVMVRGSIVESGGRELADRLEKEGYKRYGITESA
ncbi:Fe-S cluster assembly ATPase SufC [Candidatus Peribacteria bacterium]|nr:Fe-S cluster assembly ATPase SufC [Candidatus Peribacteria bacterium]